MKAMTKEELKNELENLARKMKIIDEIREELSKENPYMTMRMLSASTESKESAVVAQKFVEILSAFLKVENPPAVKIELEKRLN